MEMKNKKSGSITLIAILTLSFISYIIFSTSSLLTTEIGILKDQNNILDNKNKMTILDNIFKDYLKIIDDEINSNDNIEDIIAYISKKGKDYIFLNNYPEEVESDSGFKIKSISLHSYCDIDNILDISFDFRKWEKEFNYQKIIEQNSIKIMKNTGFIKFEKKIENIFIEGINKEYQLIINGILVIEYGFKNNFNEKSITSCKLKEMSFKLYEI